jgi:hypothetical protein
MRTQHDHDYGMVCFCPACVDEVERAAPPLWNQVAVGVVLPLIVLLVLAWAMWRLA